MAVRNSAYDILLNSEGYMLARKDQLTQGGRSWSVESAGFSTTQQSADEKRYGTAPPTVEATMVWRTTHMGYGEERQRIEGAYNYTINADARFYEQVIPGPKVYTIDIGDYTTNITGFAEFNGSLYANNGRYINAIATTNLPTALDLEYFAVGKSATDLQTFDDQLIIACGLTEPIVALDTAGDWVESPGVETGATTLYATHLTKWTDYLYGSVATGYQVAMVASGADPLNYENWSGLSTIGDQTTSITSLAASHVLVYVGKQDGLHALDASAVSPPLTPELRGYISDDNCANMLAWHGSMWVPHLRGLLAYKDLGDTGFSLRSVGPGRNLTSGNPIRGSITAMAGDDNWLYAALYTGEDTYILAGRDYTFSEGQTAMLWHPLIQLEDTKCEAMILSGLWDSPRLFFGINQDAGYIILPQNSDNPLQDSSCFVEETPVWSPHHIGLASRRSYSGELVKLATASGKQLTGTPNHPILTNRGWVPIGMLKEGDNVVSRRPSDEFESGGLHINNAEAPIGQVFDLANVVSPRWQMAVDEQLYGYGQDGDIQIVRPDSGLQDGVQATSSEPFCKNGLALSERREVALLDECQLASFFGGPAAPPACHVRGLCARCPFSGAHLGTPTTHLFATRADDASALESSRHGGQGNADGLGEFARGLASDVSLDQVVHVERVDFSGHVYNLQTDSEWYVANGIIVHNCRYASTGSIYYSAHSWNAPSTTKMWKSIEIQADNLGRMQYVSVYYRVDKGSWVDLGDAKVSPSTSLGITPSGVAGEEIEIRLDFVQLSEQTPIVIRGVIARGIERPETTDIISAVVRCADRLPLRTTGYCPRTGATILGELKALGYYPTSVTLVDPIGAERQVVVIPPVTEQAEYAQTGEMSRELLINLQMAVVEFEESRYTEVTVFGGGSGHALLVPVTVPITLGGENVNASVTFTSSKVSRPRITIIGSFGADLVITNTTTGHVLDFTGTTIGPTKIITIDMHTTVPTVLDEAGDDWSGYLVDSGLNTFVVTTGSNTITATATGAVAASKIYLEY